MKLNYSLGILQYFDSPPFKNKPCDSYDLNFESNLAYFRFNLSIFDYFETEINKTCSEMAKNRLKQLRNYLKSTKISKYSYIQVQKNRTQSSEMFLNFNLLYLPLKHAIIIIPRSKIFRSFFHKKFKNFEDVKILKLYFRIYVICENVRK